ncbi:hypothetical protein A3F66_01735 [candidate division TM6 bacterium RIFCSPHIGHO2_12_FULL_32_22]|nr:MAG: hypothetical protein A3F66_01735 [candidate division TM6 bacterium RIFCSPHIGHO2_12_FULL_32_22]
MTNYNDSAHHFMKLALKQAEKALLRDEVPIGAIVVDKDGTILSRAYNLVQKKKSPLAHAEILAIEKAAKKIGDWRLAECTIYVTLEPCSMCMSVIDLSRISKLVFASKSSKYGYKINEALIFNRNRSKLKIVENILADDSIKLLQNFFKKKRKKTSERKKIVRSS